MQISVCFYDESEYFRHYNLTTHRYRYTNSNRNRLKCVYSPKLYSCFKITVFVVGEYEGKMKEEGGLAKEG